MPPIDSPPEIYVEDWWSRAEGKRAVALRMVEDREHCREAWHAAGTAVEFALKAVIMKRRGLNRWPDKDERPELHTHVLPKLLDEAGISRSAVPAGLRGKLKTVLDWDRAHDYVPGRMPRKQARTMVEATFGEDGVIAWLTSL